MKMKGRLLSQLSIYIALSTLLQAQSYSVVQIENEYRLLFEEFHFMSVLTEGGIHAYRPHPGFDINGWGSTWYAQPFLAGAILGHSTIDSLVANEQGVFCYSKGLVSKNESETFGQWSMSIQLEYFPELKKISGTGEYNISLDSNLSTETGDLNLFKIASNYLFDVPLLCDTINGETGDMEHAEFYGNSYANPIVWIPTDSNLFVWDYVDTLCIDVEECYNHVDTETQGYYPIEPAYKPGMKVTLNSLDTGLEMIVGGIYDFELGQDFWEDNVGITPLILASCQQTEFSFTIDFESEVTVAQTATPVIFPESNNFIDSLEVSISCDTIDAEIYYTLDGSVPNISSIPFTGPFYIDTTTIIKTKAYKCGLESSDIVVKEYDLYNQTQNQYPDTPCFGIYPNPFTESFTIEYPNFNVGKSKISIYDVLGSLVYEREIMHTGALFNTKIDCFEFNSGLYIIEINFGQNLFIGRIIKNK